MMVEGLGHQDIDSRSGNRAPIGGLAAEFYLRIARDYSPGTSTPRYRFEAKVAERVIDAWLLEKSVRQLRGKRISEAAGSVHIEGGKITSFRVEDGIIIAGKVFIDGTVEGDLMALAGVTHTHWREGNATYNENVGGVINPTSHDQYNVNVDPCIIPGNPASGVIPGVQDETVGIHGSADDSGMGYCLRLPLTRNPANKIPITAPPGYSAGQYERYRRFLAAGGSNNWLDGPGSIDSSTTTTLFDLGSWHNLSGNFYGINHAYPNGTYAQREQVYQEHKSFTQGLIHYLSTDPGVPASIRNEWSRWGLPAEEFTDTGGWPRLLYVRCARRTIADYVIRNGSVYNEGAYIDYTNYRPFGIPYRSMIPKRADCSNLLVPSALSSSYAGYGAVRLEWTYMVLGQSAGIAAALAVDGGTPVQDVSYDALKTLRLARAQRLSLVSEEVPGGAEVMVDNAEELATAGITAPSLSPAFRSRRCGTDKKPFLINN